MITLCDILSALYEHLESVAKVYWTALEKVRLFGPVAIMLASFESRIEL